jgi:hypothetical protein
MTLRKPEENGRSCRNKITLHWSQYIFRFRNPGATHFIHIQNKRNTKHRATHHYPAFAGLLRLSLFTSSTHLSGPSWLLWLSVLFLLSAAVSSLCCSNGLLLPPVFCGECSFSFSSLLSNALFADPRTTPRVASSSAPASYPSCP